MRLISTNLRCAIVLALSCGSAWADDDRRQIVAAAERVFLDMPSVQFVSDMAGHCGAGRSVMSDAAYCATQNVVLVEEAADVEPQALYRLAHVYGHAVQIRHGVADIALREILSRRDEEAKLRGWVTRQVECIAGVIFAASSLPVPSLSDIFEDEPMTGSHWGRDPLRVGPKVSIGLDARAHWFAIGAMGDLSACEVGEFGSDLLRDARR